MMVWCCRGAPKKTWRKWIMTWGFLGILGIRELLAQDRCAWEFDHASMDARCLLCMRCWVSLTDIKRIWWWYDENYLYLSFENLTILLIHNIEQFTERTVHLQLFVDLSTVTVDHCKIERPKVSIETAQVYKLLYFQLELVDNMLKALPNDLIPSMQCFLFIHTSYDHHHPHSFLKHSYFP